MKIDAFSFCHFLMVLIFSIVNEFTMYYSTDNWNLHRLKEKCIGKLNVFCCILDFASKCVCKFTPNFKAKGKYQNVQYSKMLSRPRDKRPKTFCGPSSKLIQSLCEQIWRSIVKASKSIPWVGEWNTHRSQQNGHTFFLNRTAEIILLKVVIDGKLLKGMILFQRVVFQRVKNPSTTKKMLHYIYAYAGSGGGTAHWRPHYYKFFDWKHYYFDQSAGFSASQFHYCIFFTILKAHV